MVHCQADSAVATVSKTKELTKRMGPRENCFVSFGIPVHQWIETGGVVLNP